MTLDRYLEAATRENTRRSYASAVRHFEVEWGGHLPATADNVARYLAEYAGQLATNTLKQRLAALAQWGSPPFSRTLTRRPIEALRSVHVEAKEVQH